MNISGMSYFSALAAGVVVVGIVLWVTGRLRRPSGPQPAH